MKKSKIFYIGYTYWNGSQILSDYKYIKSSNEENAILSLKVDFNKPTEFYKINSIIDIKLISEKDYNKVLQDRENRQRWTSYLKD